MTGAAGTADGARGPAGRAGAPQWLELLPLEAGTDRASRLFRQTFGHEPRGTWSAPGRVNLIGEHTDYNGGTCLPLALPHRTFVALAPRPDGLVRAVSEQQGSRSVWSTDLSEVGPGEVDGWGGYVAGVAWALAASGTAMSGFDVAVVSAVPPGAGLSSSAALESAVALGLDAVLGLGLAADDDGRARLAAACVRAENDIVGAPTGGMDQAVALRSRPGHALLLDTLHSAVRHVPLGLDGATLLVIDTRTAHDLADGQYGERRAACERAAEILGLGTLREVRNLDAALAALSAPSSRLGPDAETLVRRVRHVVTEIRRVDEAVAALAAGDLGRFGAVLDAGHHSLRDDFEVSSRELDLAQEAAVDAGALGARMTGGGFGGSVVALVPTERLGTVAAAVAAAFARTELTPPAFLRAA